MKAAATAKPAKPQKLTGSFAASFKYCRSIFLMSAITFCQLPASQPCARAALLSYQLTDKQPTLSVALRQRSTSCARSCPPRLRSERQEVALAAAWSNRAADPCCVCTQAACPAIVGSSPLARSHASDYQPKRHRVASWLRLR